MDYEAGRAEFAHISPELITRDILGLVTTKDIMVVGTIRGDSRGLTSTSLAILILGFTCQKRL